ncbi:hypothetical protein ACF052_32200 [Streptomyces pilosus]|uniref:GP88 family protein n=1 Tax=Streptomyces pilosus TaxID=28893 RepID=UPI0037001FF1
MKTGGGLDPGAECVGTGGGEVHGVVRQVCRGRGWRAAGRGRRGSRRGARTKSRADPGTSDSDLLAVLGPVSVGIPSNNIPAFRRLMQGRTFRRWQAERDAHRAAATSRGGSPIP